MNVIVNFNEVMRIDANGNIGIGTTSPSSRLTIEEKEDLTEWYKKGVETKGLTPHKKENNGT